MKLLLSLLILIIAITPAFSQMTFSEICQGKAYINTYKHGKELGTKFMIEGGESELYYSYDIHLEQWSYYIIAYEQKDYLIYFKRNIFSSKEHINTLKVYKNVNTSNELFESLSDTNPNTISAISRIVLSSGFKAGHNGVDFKTQFVPCDVSYSTALIEESVNGIEQLANTIDFLPPQEKLIVYPNPVKRHESIINIEIGSKKNNGGRVLLTSLSNPRNRIEIELEPGTGKIILPTNLPSGIYSVSYYDIDGTILNSKIILE